MGYRGLSRWRHQAAKRSFLGAAVAFAIGASLLGPADEVAAAQVVPGAASLPQAVLGDVASSRTDAGAAAGGLVLAQIGGFSDVADDAYYSAPVEALAAAGVFAGTECDEGFCPDAPLDRATMAVWTVRVLDGEDPAPVGSTRFADVDGSHRHAAFIGRFDELGVTQGCGDGTRFCPDETVTRAQMAVFLSRAFSLADGPDPNFSDVPADAWYAPDVAKLAASRITKGCGDGTAFCPDDDTNRAQMATFLHRALGRDDPPGPPPEDQPDQDEGSDVLEGPGGSGAPEPIKGDWVIPVFVCEPAGQHTAADLREWTNALNDELAGFFGRLSSGRMTLSFTPGSVLTDAGAWESLKLGPLRLQGIFPCGTEASRRAGTSQVLILADFPGTGYARVGSGPAVGGTPELRPDWIRTVVHELGHSVLGLRHIRHREFGRIWENEGIASIDFDEFLNRPVLACYQYEQLGWPVHDYAQPCSRLSPGQPESLSYGQMDDSAVVTWEPPHFSDDVPVTGYVLKLYTGTGYSHRDIPYAEFQLPPATLRHIIDESIAPGTYLAVVSARSKYGEGDTDAVLVDWAPLPPSFGPIRVRDVTHDTIHLIVDAEDHRDFQDETNESVIYEVQYTARGQTDHEEVWGGAGDLLWFSLTDLEPDTEYTIRVRACTNPYSVRRCTGWISTEASTSAAGTLRPPAPISVTTGSDWYLLTWDLVPGAGSYVIESPDLGRLQVPTPDFERGYGVEPDTSYSVKVGSCRSRTFSCEDGERTEVTFTTAAEPTVAPPYRVALREIGDSWVTLMWKTLGNQGWRYRAEYEYTDGTTSSGRLHRQHQGEIPLRLTVEPNKSYDFKVRNCPLEEHDSACSAWTSFAFSTSPTASPVAAPSITVADRADVWLGFSWEHVTGAVSYESRYQQTGDSRWLGWQNVQTPSVELVSFMEPETEYTVQVRSCGEPTKPCSSWATTTTTTARSLPSAPSEYPVSIVAVTGSEVHLAWDEPTPGGGYELRWHPTDERGRTYVNGTMEFADAVISYLEPGTAYTIAVRTCRWSAGFVCDDWVTLNATTRQQG